MFVKYLPQIIILVALVGIVIFIARKVPKIKDRVAEGIPESEPSSVEKKIKSKAFWEKFQKTISVTCRSIAKGVVAIAKGFSAGFVMIKKEINKKPFVKKEKSIINLGGVSDNSKEGFAGKANVVKNVFKTALAKKLDEARKLKGEGKFQDAEKIYIDLVVSNPKSPKSYEELGRVYMDMQNFKDAAASFEQAISLGTKNQNNIYPLTARCFFKSELYKKALEYAEMANDVDPKDIESLKIIVGVHKRNKNEMLERIALEKIVAINPQDSESVSRLNTLKSI